MPDVNTIQELLKQARATLDAGDLDQAEKLYRQAMDDAAPLDLDVFDAALDGVQEVKRRRQESSPAPKSAPKRPASGPLPPSRRPLRPTRSLRPTIVRLRVSSFPRLSRLPAPSQC